MKNETTLIEKFKEKEKSFGRRICYKCFKGDKVMPLTKQTVEYPNGKREEVYFCPIHN